jgi:hypothetical protein
MKFHCPRLIAGITRSLSPKIIRPVENDFRHRGELNMVERFRQGQDKRSKPARRPSNARSRGVAPYACFIVIASLLPVLIASSAKAGQLTVGQDWAIGALSFAFALMLILSATLARHLMRNFLAGIRSRQDRLR